MGFRASHFDLQVSSSTPPSGWVVAVRRVLPVTTPRSNTGQSLQFPLDRRQVFRRAPWWHVPCLILGELRKRKASAPLPVFGRRPAPPLPTTRPSHASSRATRQSSGSGPPTWAAPVFSWGNGARPGPCRKHPKRQALCWSKLAPYSLCLEPAPVTLPLSEGVVVLWRLVGAQDEQSARAGLAAPVPVVVVGRREPPECPSEQDRGFQLRFFILRVSCRGCPARGAPAPLLPVSGEI